VDITDTRSSSRAATAVTELYAGHALSLVRLAVLLVGDRASAEDVVQDAFLGLYRRWDCLPDTSSPLAYLRVSVLNGCRTALRGRARSRHRQVFDVPRARRHRPDAQGGIMTEPEDLVRSTTRAIAGTVRDVPPLRLAPAVDDLRSFAPRARRWRRLRGWLAPVTTAAAVLAVAVSVVIIRDISNGPVVPPAASASALTVPPRYYVAIPGAGTGWYPDAATASKQSFPRNDLVVGDTATGKRLATIASPPDTVWTG
jgi:DNA-directed RNA polymerase specialized sigma24 family protein